MRIIGGHDYYDNGMAYGHDDSIILVRHPKSGMTLSNTDDGYRLGDNYEHIKIPKAPDCFSVLIPPRLSLNKYSGCDYEIMKSNNGLYNISLTAFKIMFCGVIYNGITINSIYDYTTFPSSDILVDSKGEHKPVSFYKVDELIEFLESKGIDLNTIEGNKRYQPKDYAKNFKRVLEKTMQSPVEITGDLREWIVKNTVSIITSRVNDYHDWFHVNDDNLADFDFYRVMDSFRAFQELEMWIGGVLPKHAKPTIQLDDREIATKHGCDQWSFRKMPTKKR